MNTHKIPIKYLDSEWPNKIKSFIADGLIRFLLDGVNWGPFLLNNGYINTNEVINGCYGLVTPYRKRALKKALKQLKSIGVLEHFMQHPIEKEHIAYTFTNNFMKDAFDDPYLKYLG